MTVEVTWNGKISNDPFKRKRATSIDDEMSDEFDFEKDKNLIINVLKKKIAEEYDVIKDSIVIEEIKLAEDSAANAPEPKVEEEAITISSKEIEEVMKPKGLEENFEVDEFTKLLYHKLNISPQLDDWIAQIDFNIKQLELIASKYRAVKDKIVALKGEV